MPSSIRIDLSDSPPSTQRSQYKDHLWWEEGVLRHYRLSGDEKEGEQDAEDEKCADREANGGVESDA